jgi:hypothetical protein
MALEDKINAALNIWGRILVSDMRESINQALKKGAASKKTGTVNGWKSPSSSDLSASVRMEVTGNTFSLYMNDYWEAVDKGRGESSGSGTGAVRKNMGREWMAKAGINPSRVLQEITQNYYAKKGIKRKAPRLQFDKAVKSLSYILSRTVHEKGTNPRPFYDRVINEQRLQDLRDLLGKEIANEIRIEITK